MSRIRNAEISPGDYEEGLRCADCGALIIERWGEWYEDYHGRLVYERRGEAVALTGSGQRIAWTWALICDRCAQPEIFQGVRPPTAEPR